MKRRLPLFIAFFMLMAMPALAQEGLVTYEETIQMNVDLPPEMEHMRDHIPSSRSTTMHLYFNESASLFKAAPQEADAEEDMHGMHDMHGGGGMVRIQVAQNENETYASYDNSQIIAKRDFMDRTFLIESDLDALKWRLTDERSEFLGYMAQKATAKRDTMVYEAWFTPEINVPTGPGYGGLPGLILVLNIDDGQRTYVAQELSLEPVEDGTIKAPKKGKKVSQEEFDQIVAEKMEEMNLSGGNSFVIRMRH